MTKGLYLHIPFCKSKCRYCSFNSFSGISFLQREYIDAVIRGIKNLKRDNIDTVYIGGGTPSFVDEKLIQKLMDTVSNHFYISKNAEITIEVNPATIDSEKIRIYKNSGINRVSMGVQTMNDDELKAIGRAHTKKDAIKSYEIIRNCGIENVSLDLMYALPNQSEESLIKTILEMVELNPEHISCYGLSIDEGTLLFEDLKKGKFKEKTDEEYYSMYERIRKALKENGYSHYEISNFSKTGYESRHNSSYWKANEYYAMGSGAYGYIDGERFSYNENVEEFILNPDFYTVDEKLTQKNKMSEFVILGLRLLKEGVNKIEFEKRFSKNIYDVFGKQIQKNVSIGMLEDKKDRIVISEKAYFVSNAIMTDFIF